LNNLTDPPDHIPADDNGQAEHTIPEDDQTFALDLTGLIYGGNAIGRHDGRAIFVPYGLPGERVIVQVTQDRGRFAYAEILERIGEAAPERVTPRCPHFGPGKCGGCHWQHIDYEAQLWYKTEIVREQLQRLGGIKEALVYPMIASPDPWMYRSHATFSVAGDGRLGFVDTDDTHVMPITECHILRPELLALFHDLSLDVPTLNRVRLQVGSASDDLLVAFSTSDDQAPAIEVDIPASVAFLPAENEPVALVGSTYVTYTVKGHAFRVTAGGFFQVNLRQAEVLIDLVIDRLALTGRESVLELYAGVGMFTPFLAENAGLVTTIESFPSAVADAEINLAAYDNIDLIEGAVEDVLGALEEPFFDVALLDPPRQGLEGIALDELVKLAPRTIVYVSCDPATLARDAKRLAGKGYQLRDVQPVDMFPQTYHIEAVATFDKVGLVKPKNVTRAR